jgi:hypothetical protein
MRRMMMIPHGSGGQMRQGGGMPGMKGGGSGSGSGDGPMAGSMRNAGGVGMLIASAEKFGLSGDQVKKLEGMKHDFQMEKVDVQAAVYKAKLRLKRLMKDPQAAEGDVMAAIDAVAAAEGDVRKMRYRHLKAARGTLQGDQMSKVMDHAMAMDHQHLTAG